MNSWTGERLEPGIFGEVSAEHLHRYALAIELAKGKKVLDIACGEGYGSYLLAQSADAVQGADISDEVVEAARKKYQLPNLQFTSTHAATLPFPSESFDLVVSFETLEHLDEQEEMLLEIKRVLKPNGLLIISTPDKKWYTDHRQYKNPHHVRELYRGEFESLLAKNFSHHSIYEQQFFSGSILINPGQAQFQNLKGDFKSIEKEENKPLYLVAFASDGELPSLPNTLFRSDNLYEAALQQKEAAIKSSISYRLGHLILLPFKWIKKIFQGT